LKTSTARILAGWLVLAVSSAGAAAHADGTQIVYLDPDCVAKIDGIALPTQSVDATAFKQALMQCRRVVNVYTKAQVDSLLKKQRAAMQRPPAK
jgi:hypothetical protein